MQKRTNIRTPSPHYCKTVAAHLSTSISLCPASIAQSPLSQLPRTNGTEAEADAETDECWHSLAARLQHCRHTSVPINNVMPRLNCSITSLTETKADAKADDFLHLH